MAVILGILCGFLFALTSSEDAGTTPDYLIESTDGYNMTDFGDMGGFLNDIFGGDQACSEMQSETIYNCSDLIEDELNLMSPQAKEIANLTNILFEHNQAYAFTQDLTHDADASFSFGSPPSLESEPGQMNLSEIAHTLRNHPNETKEMLKATCRGMNRFVACSDEAIQDSDCNPLSYRVPKAVGEVLCDKEFQSMMFANQDCLLSVVEDTQIEECLGHLNDTASQVVMEAMLGDDGSFGDAICTISATALECVRPSVEACGYQIFEQSSRMAYKVISAVFNVECNADAAISDEFGDENDIKEDSNPEIGSESVEIEGGNVEIPETGDSDEPMVEEKVAKVLDADEQVAIDPIKKEDESDDLKTN